MTNTTGVIFSWFMIPLCCVAAADQPQHAPATDECLCQWDGGLPHVPNSALLVTPKGDWLAFCEGRKKQPLRYGRHRPAGETLPVDGGRTWSPSQIVWNDGPNTCGNPCPVVDRTTGVIWLPMTWNRPARTRRARSNGIRAKTRGGRFVTHSDDDGRDLGQARRGSPPRRSGRTGAGNATGPASASNWSAGPRKEGC